MAALLSRVGHTPTLHLLERESAIWYNHSSITELLTAAVFMGMLIGGVVAGNAGDILGRRYCLLISLSVTVTFGTLSALAPSIAWLIAARVIAGIGESNGGSNGRWRN